MTAIKFSAQVTILNDFDDIPTWEEFKSEIIEIIQQRDPDAQIFYSNIGAPHQRVLIKFEIDDIYPPRESGKWLTMFDSFRDRSDYFGSKIFVERTHKRNMIRPSARIPGETVQEMYPNVD